MGPNISRLPDDPRPILPPRPADDVGRPEILLISLGGMINTTISYNNLVYSLLYRGARVTLAMNRERCLLFLKTGRVPKAIIVADQWIQHPQNSDLLRHVQYFVGTGGSVIFCLDFATRMDPQLFQVFMAQVFGVRWRFHDRTEEDIFICYNSDAVPPEGIAVLNGLPASYSERVTLIDNVQPDNRLFVEIDDLMPPEQLDFHPALHPAEHSLGAPGAGILSSLFSRIARLVSAASNLFRTEATNDSETKTGKEPASEVETAQVNDHAHGGQVSQIYEGILDMATAYAIAEGKQNVQVGDDDYGGIAAVAAARMQMGGLVVHGGGWVMYCGNNPEDEPWWFSEKKDETSESIATLCGLNMPVNEEAEQEQHEG